MEGERAGASEYLQVPGFLVYKRRHLEGAFCRMQVRARAAWNVVKSRWGRMWGANWMIAMRIWDACMKAIVEVWGVWKRPEFEREQVSFLKSLMGLERSPPGYIALQESNRMGVVCEARARVARS
jgi:hypothetical protein